MSIAARADTGSQPLWRPSPERVADSQLVAFRAEANRRHGLNLADFRALHAWSVAQTADFWGLVWDFCGVVGEKGERRLTEGDRMPGARFFPDAKLNFAENLLGKPGHCDALIFRDEDNLASRMSWEELTKLVSRLQQALRAHGVGPGDRVAAMIPNLPETVALMLAVTSLGAIFSSCSPDFGSAASSTASARLRRRSSSASTAIGTTASPSRSSIRLRPLPGGFIRLNWS
jgi:acetoacetyl-CoA synthetase